MVNENSPEQKTLTFTCGTSGVYHFLVPVRAGGITVRVPLTITVTSPLPVTLTSFDAANEGNAVSLNWETSEETNSDRFDLEWGTDGKTWIKIGSVRAANGSNAFTKYSFQHSMPAAGENLYRLKMVDKDLTFAYSQIRNVHVKAGSDNAVYPNPVTGGKLYSSNWTDIKRLEIYNLMGRKVASFEPSEKDKMMVSNLQSNAYYRLKMIDLDGTFAYSRLINIQNPEAEDRATFYPNPVAKYLNVRTASAGTVSVFNQTGTVVSKRQINAGESTISIEKLIPGQYFININGSQYKFVKQ